jgi:hypothetical protein
MTRVFILVLLFLFAYTNSQAQTPAAKRKNALYNITETGMLYGNAGGDAGIVIKSALGYRFHQHYSVGIGAGFQEFMLFKVDDRNQNRLSGWMVNADLRYYILDKKITPFVYGNPGILHLTTMNIDYMEWEPTTFAPFVDLGAGAAFHWNDRNAFLLSIGYQHAATKGEARVQVVDNKQSIEYNINRFTLKIGITL